MSTSARNSVAAAQTGAELLVKSLEAQGVEYVFGIPGAKIDAVFDTLLDSKINTVVCRHEQNAAFIAGGIGRMTGSLAVIYCNAAERICGFRFSARVTITWRFQKRRISSKQIYAGTRQRISREQKEKRNEYISEKFGGRRTNRRRVVG